MKNSPDTLPYNPFVTDPDAEILDTETEGTLTIYPDQVGYSAAGFEALADVSDWSAPELQVLRDAAAFVRWAGHWHGLSESRIVNNRVRKNGSLLLAYRAEILDDREK